MNNTSRYNAATIMFHGDGYIAARDYIRSYVMSLCLAEQLAADIHHLGE